MAAKRATKFVISLTAPSTLKADPSKPKLLADKAFQRRQSRVFSSEINALSTYLQRPHHAAFNAPGVNASSVFG